MNAETRSIEKTIQIKATADEVFHALVTPSAIRNWWQANRAIVLAKPGGCWIAAWGNDEDDPEYVCGYTLAEFSRPQRLVFSHPIYYSKSGPLSFDAEFVVTFQIEPDSESTRLTVVHQGFPCDRAADEFYQGCLEGWQTTLSNLADYLHASPWRAG